jgi:hypothetical protein
MKFLLVSFLVLLFACNNKEDKHIQEKHAIRQLPLKVRHPDLYSFSCEPVSEEEYVIQERRYHGNFKENKPFNLKRSIKGDTLFISFNLFTVNCYYQGNIQPNATSIRLLMGCFCEENDTQSLSLELLHIEYKLKNRASFQNKKVIYEYNEKAML